MGSYYVTPERPQMPVKEGENIFKQEFKDRKKLYENSPEYEAKWKAKQKEMPGPIISFESKQFYRNEPSEWDKPNTSGKKVWYTVTKAKILDLKIKQFKHHSERRVDNAKVLDEKIKMHILEPLDGYGCTLTKIKMPMMYADRSIINVYYPQDNEDGSHTIISSSEDTAMRAAA